MRIALIFLMLFFGGLTLQLNAQFTDRYWAFGDSCAVDWKTGTPIGSTSILRAVGTCASICDSAGNLLFYAGSPNVNLWLGGYVAGQGYLVNSSHQIISNGDSLAKSGVFLQEMTIVPKPSNTNQFYVFHMCSAVNGTKGLAYSVVDMSLNNGKGFVIQKNVNLFDSSFQEGPQAIRHANGRDWWLITKPYSAYVFSNDFYIYLITPNGVSGPSIQSVGTLTSGSGSATATSEDGENLYYVNVNNLIETYDFDRCTGVLSNPITIKPLKTGNFNNLFFFRCVQVSSDKSKLYVNSLLPTNSSGINADSSYLFQIDLTQTNPWSKRDTIAIFPFDPNNGGTSSKMMKRGPDQKIYVAKQLIVNDCQFDYLYCDTTWSSRIEYLSVINNPNSAGAACNYQMNGVYLNGHRSYAGLPNNPNYELGKIIGSLCDTLGTVSILENTIVQPELFVFYDTDWDKVFINAKGLEGKRCVLELFDVKGQLIFTEPGEILNGYYTKGLTMENFASGLYLVSLRTEEYKMVKKMVKD